jgi:hypothetical protein
MLLLLAPDCVLAKPSYQKYAPVVGRWRIEIKVADDLHSLEFETDGTGRFGLGTGYLVARADMPRGRKYPAAWTNRDPQRISISAEIVLASRNESKQGTLILRTTLAPGEDVKGDVIFIDQGLTVHRGSFSMKQILGPEQIEQKDK